jgi:hypothetical protein
LFITFSHQTLIAQHQVTPQEKDPPFFVNRIDTGSGGFPVRLLPLDIRQYVKKSESLCGDLIIKRYFLLVCVWLDLAYLSNKLTALLAKTKQ